MLKKIALALALLVAGLLAFIATRPAAFRITRTATLPAPAALVFTQVNDLHRWNEWSPWARLDPHSKITYTGPTAGVGAAMAWAGNHEVGEGRMTITESRPHELVRMQLEFIKPFAATNDTEFTFQPHGEQTVLTWTMSGRNNFLGKAVGLVMDCDRMVGGQFEQGLANLRALLAPKAPNS